MNEHLWHERFAESAQRWRGWLEDHRLEGLAGLLLDVAEPFSMFGAQLLYVFQPTLGLLMKRDLVRDWADLLETPGGIAWLRERLVETEPDDGR